MRTETLRPKSPAPTLRLVATEDIAQLPPEPVDLFGAEPRYQCRRQALEELVHELASRKEMAIRATVDIARILGGIDIHRQRAIVRVARCLARKGTDYVENYADEVERRLGDG